MEKFRLFAAHRAGTEGLTLTVNVLLERNSSHGRIYECNVIASMLGCRDKYTDKPVPAWFVKQAAVPGRLKYINTKKFSQWISQAWLQLPEGQSIER